MNHKCWNGRVENGSLPCGFKYNKRDHLAQQVIAHELWHKRKEPSAAEEEEEEEDARINQMLYEIAAYLERAEKEGAGR